MEVRHGGQAAAEYCLAEEDRLGSHNEDEERIHGSSKLTSVLVALWWVHTSAPATHILSPDNVEPAYTQLEYQ